MADPDWTPSVADVAALLQARTKVPGDKWIGTFQDADPDADPPLAATRPNATEVTALITMAVRRVSSAIGTDPCTEELSNDAGSMAAIYAAMLIEQSYYPEQTQNAGSSFQSLRSLWNDGITTLVEAVSEQCGTGTGEGALRPKASFDDHALIGRSGPVW